MIAIVFTYSTLLVMLAVAATSVSSLLAGFATRQKRWLILAVTTAVLTSVYGYDLMGWHRFLSGNAIRLVAFFAWAMVFRVAMCTLREARLLERYEEMLVNEDD